MDVRPFAFHLPISIERIVVYIHHCRASQVPDRADYLISAHPLDL